MKVVKLYGGLGNQFFQYAFGKSLAKITGDEIKYDTSWFETGADYDHDTLYLDFFNTEYKVANESEIEGLYLFGEVGKRTAERLYHKLPVISQLLFGHFKEIERDIDATLKSEPYLFEYSPTVYRSGNSYYDGYWQASQYVEEVSETLIQDFSLTVPMSEQGQTISKKITDSESISIHIRRGDYTRNDNTLPMEYYKRAVERIDSCLDNHKYFIFSDDIEWTRNNLTITADCVYVDHNGTETAYEDLMLMSSCDHNIIANSTFSWWGAWLNQNSDKTVIAPGVWLGGANTSEIDILPDAWNIIH